MPEERINHYRCLLKRLKQNQGNYRGAPRREIIALVDGLRSSGWQLKDICSALGLAKHTVYSWRRALAGEQPGGPPVPQGGASFLPVVQDGEEPQAVHCLTILSPAGYSLSGLSLEDAVLAMRSLP
jgi:transposase-like protein